MFAAGWVGMPAPFPARGYSVVGVDSADKAIAAAQELNRGPHYIQADIRDYQPAPGKFDAAIVMGQSFGHFDEAANQSILSRLANTLRPGGRVILDVWNPDFFTAHQGERELQTARGNVREVKRLDGDRLFVQLDYPDGNRERFEWQLFTPKKMEQFVKGLGIKVLSACSNFDSRTPPSPADPRLQFVLKNS